MLKSLIESPVKLNLGSRDRDIPGFKNMDIDKHANVDYVGDVSDLSRFEDKSVSEIYASHILEHFPHTQTLKVLKEWRRVLNDGGILYIGVPDFRRTIELYTAINGINDWIINYLYGDQEYTTAFHYTAFDERRLSDFLLKAGFSEASRVEFFRFNNKDCSNNRSSFDGKPVSLNMVAIA